MLRLIIKPAVLASLLAVVLLLAQRLVLDSLNSATPLTEMTIAHQENTRASYLTNLKGGETDLVRYAGADVRGLRCSPDGDHLIFATDTDIYVGRADGSAIETVERSSGVTEFTVANGGQVFAYIDTDPNPSEIVVVDRERGQRQTFSASYDIWHINLSPDGTQLTFQNNDGFAISVIDLATRVRRRYTNSSIHPIWTPDGDQLTMINVTLRGSVIDSTAPRALRLQPAPDAESVFVTHVGPDDYFPAWTPDGDILAMISWQDGASNYQLLLADPRTGRLHTVNEPVRWRPCFLNAYPDVLVSGGR